MLKACGYCGRIHKPGERCTRAPPRKSGGAYRDDPQIRAFRDSAEWQNKRNAIKERDRWLCLACLHRAARTLRQYNSRRLSVHHIVPLHIAWDLRMDDDNLITLCDTHHTRADAGGFSAEVLRSWATETARSD